MEKALLCLVKKAQRQLPAATGYAREQMQRVIFDAKRVIADLRNPYKDRGLIRDKAIAIMICAAEAGLYD